MGSFFHSLAFSLLLFPIFIFSLAILITYFDPKTIQPMLLYPYIDTPVFTGTRVKL